MRRRAQPLRARDEAVQPRRHVSRHAAPGVSSARSARASATDSTLVRPLVALQQRTAAGRGQVATASQLRLREQSRRECRRHVRIGRATSPEWTVGPVAAPAALRQAAAGASPQWAILETNQSWRRGYMAAPREESVSFARPPLVELALAVQFEPLDKLQGPELGLWWAQIRDRFPIVERYAPRPTAQELFGESVVAPQVRFALSDAPPLPLYWFLSEDKTELIQLQQDRFVANWRKGGADQEYPRYSHVRRRFEEEFTSLMGFIESEGIGHVNPNQCEITYVNHMIAGDGWEDFSQMDRVFTVWAPHYNEPFTLPLEDARFTARYGFTDVQGAALGRLYVAVEPAYRIEDRKPMIVMTLTARGRPDGPAIDGVMSFIDRGHDAALLGFKAVTTTEMQKRWGDDEQ